MMRFVFILVCIATSLPEISKAAASVEYACGTKIGMGSFYSETGRMICEDKVGDVQKEIYADDKHEIFCFY